MSDSYDKYPRRVRAAMLLALCLTTYLALIGLAVAVEAVVDVF